MHAGGASAERSVVCAVRMNIGLECAFGLCNKTILLQGGKGCARDARMDVRYREAWGGGRF